MEIDCKVLFKALLTDIFLLKSGQLSVFRDFKNRLHEAFAVIFCHEIHHRPFDSIFTCWVIDKGRRVKRMVILRRKEGGRPPPIKSLK